MFNYELTRPKKEARPHVSPARKLISLPPHAGSDRSEALRWRWVQRRAYACRIARRASRRTLGSLGLSACRGGAGFSLRPRPFRPRPFRPRARPLRRAPAGNGRGRDQTGARAEAAFDPSIGRRPRAATCAAMPPPGRAARGADLVGSNPGLAPAARPLAPPCPHTDFRGLWRGRRGLPHARWQQIWNVRARYGSLALGARGALGGRAPGNARIGSASLRGRRPHRAGVSSHWPHSDPPLARASRAHPRLTIAPSPCAPRARPAAVRASLPQNRRARPCVLS
jgi:hypothetical protein